jgi:hypothetical protein
MLFSSSLHLLFTFSYHDQHEIIKRLTPLLNGYGSRRNFKRRVPNLQRSKKALQLKKTNKNHSKKAKKNVGTQCVKN